MDHQIRQWLLPVRTYHKGTEPEPEVQLWTIRATSVDGPVLALQRSESPNWVRTVFMTDVESEDESSVIFRPIVVMASEKFDPGLWGWGKVAEGESA